MVSDGLKVGDYVFCAYLNDNDEKRDGYFTIIEISATAAILKTNTGGVLFLPISRVLKIKKRGYDGS